MPSQATALTSAELGAEIVACAAEIWTWRMGLSMNGVTTPRPDGDPGPDEWPEDREAYAAGSANDPPQGPVGQAPPRCKCGTEQEYKQGDTWIAYFCPDQVKSKDPRIQEEQKLLHPPVWL